MTEPDAPTQAVALLHSTHHPATYEALTRKHRLTIVHTIHTDTVAVLAALIPHFGALEPRTPWWWSPKPAT
ncbi:hypothetical protein [Nocardia cyriacigeorgica]|uniref:hypothetical protein n=1 Tax=Nocardia cyriacigeorgica TaxID=135487 RepID=UPI002457152F|nr:hypothetical protein [Nocardia cyriacigeorgica]